MEGIENQLNKIFDSLGSTRILPVENDERVETFRRSIVASREIKKGEVFVHDMIDFKRPGSGLSPEEEKYLIGKRAKKNIGYDDIIDINDF